MCFPSQFDDFLQTFLLERNGHIISTSVKGFFCDDCGTKAIQLCENYSIQDGDFLIEIKSQKRCFISNIYPLGENDFMAQYKTTSELHQVASQSIQIGTISGNAIVGNQQNATLKICGSFNQAKEYIKQQDIPSADKEKLQQLISAAEAITQNNLSVTKATFSQYADIAEKYSGLISIALNPLLNWLFGIK